MATTPEASDADLRNRLRGEPGVTPEDTRSELLQDGQDKVLRDNLRGVPGVAPEDTHSELLAEKAKEERKAQEADSMRQEREATARAWTEEQAKARAARDVADHADLVALGKRGEGDSFYLRSDMAMQASVNPAYDAALKAAAPELHTRVQENEKENVSVDLTAFHAANKVKEDQEPELTPLEQTDQQRSDMKAWAEAQGWMAKNSGSSNSSASTYLEISKPKEWDKEYGLLESDTIEVRFSDHGNHRNSMAEHFINVAPGEVDFNEAKESIQALMADAAPKPAEFNHPSVARKYAGLYESSTQTADGSKEQAAAVNKGLQDQLEDDLRRRKAREQEQAGQGLNSVDVQRSGKELERGDFIVPRRITQAYTEVDGKFYAKDSNRVMFEDKGEKLATSTTNKEAVADMVAYAKAKQWDSLKLSGSQEFRREAWLQAESQGIKTQGYTPKQSDLAALETLRQERSTNSITPLQERKAERETTVREEATTAAPRHDLNKNQAAMHVEASKFIATNMQALQKQPGMADKSVEDLTKLAYWRGIVAEENKLQPKPVQDEALARFDKQAVDPQFLKRLNQETEPKIQDKTTERVQKRDTHEQSL